MMARRWKLLFAASLLFVLGCNRSKRVSQGIDTQIHAGAMTVDLVPFANFNWDHLFVFGPYSYPEGMCKSLGFSSNECSAAAFQDVDENDFLLVFLKDRTICYREKFSRSKGNFGESCLGVPISRSEARFAIARRDGSVYLVCRR
jgi:hypothetical protein